MEDETFDYFQELARAAFTDMLHDTERNEKYSSALKEAIDYVKSQGKKANVLGTGTGLLAMLAARHNADSVVTIETFSPVSVFARKIIEQNSLKDKIQLINKHSTEVKVGPKDEMRQKANILVAEVFDTELIGEGAIKTYNQAHSMLLEDDCIAVPHKANIYVQLVKSKLASSWFKFHDVKINENTAIQAPEEVQRCRGLSSIHDIQLSQFPLTEFKPLTEPIKVCEFNFSKNRQIPHDEFFSHSFKAADEADSVAVFFWWDLHMNVSGSNLLSCAPYWAHPDVKSENTLEAINEVPWRDHWMQGCYYIPQKVIKDAKYQLTVCHDQFSWFFDITSESCSPNIERPVCNCFFHMTNSRNQIMQINDEQKRNGFLKLLQTLPINKALMIGDHSIVPLLAAHVSNVKSIFVYQADDLSYKSLKKFIEINNLIQRVHLTNDLKCVKDITHLIIDPYFNGSIYPTDNITQIFQIIKDLSNVNQQQLIKVYPQRARICAVPVHFINLHKIRWPLKSSCEGFNHECFDDVIELASNIADDNVEPFSLWEYPCYALGKRSNVIEVDFNGKDNGSSQQLTNTIEIDNFVKSCNGIAFWIEWVLDETDIILSTGPLYKFLSGELINWKFDRQMVHLIPHKDIVAGILKSIDIKVHLKQKITFDFSYHYEN